VALIPMFVVWLGFGFEYKLVLVFLAALFSILVNTVAGVRDADVRLIRMAKSFGASDWQLARTVVLPGAAPYVMSGLRQSVSHALLGVVIAEVLSSSAGLGFLIDQSAQLYLIDKLFAVVVFIAALAAIINQLLLFLEARTAWVT
jgi:ABC-type nitrate/sulfonate/bicarbonate transport system permease component